MRHQDRKRISDMLLASNWVRSGRGCSPFERRNRWRKNGYFVFPDVRLIKIETDEKCLDRKTIASVGPLTGIGWCQKTVDEINKIIDSLPPPEIP